LLKYSPRRTGGALTAIASRSSISLSHLMHLHTMAIMRTKKLYKNVV